MGALVQTVANNLIDGSVATSAFTASTAPIKCRLMTANGSSTAAGTEVVTGGGYTSGTSAPTITFAAAASGTAASNVAVTVTNWPRAETIAGVELWDASPARKWWGALSSSKTMAIGDTFTIASGSLTLTIN